MTDPKIQGSTASFGFPPLQEGLTQFLTTKSKGDESGNYRRNAKREIIHAILEAASVKRVCIAGGDTSGYVVPHLDIFALEFVVPVGPGSPLCRAASREAKFDGLEIALKGGQVQTAHNEEDFFGVVRDGGIPS